jgi:hypothetical protein
LLRKENAMDYGGGIGEGREVAPFLQISLNQYKIKVLYTIITRRPTDVNLGIHHNQHPF